MKYPALLLTAVFMMADYFLTIAGARLSEINYRQHITTESYELNPRWQDVVARKKWFNPKHLALTILLTLLLVLYCEYIITSPGLMQGITGFIFITYGILISRHLSNLLIFWQVNKNPDLLSGQVTLSHNLSLLISLFQTAAILVPLILIQLFSPAPFVIGAILAAVFQVLVHLIWLQQHQRKSARS